MTALVKLCCALLLQIAWQVKRLSQADRLLKMFLVPLHVGHLLRENVAAIALQLSGFASLFFIVEPEGASCTPTRQESCWPVGSLQGGIWGPE